MEELDYYSYLKKSLNDSNFELNRVFSCNNCESTFYVEKEIGLTNWPYCNTPIINSEIKTENIIKPEYIYPLK